MLGPEAPLIAIGSGLGVIAVRLAARDAPPQASIVIATAGSFAAVSALFGSPLLGAFLLLEAAGLGGPMLGVVLVPGLLSAGIGALIFLGLDDITGLGTFSLIVPDLPHPGPLTLAMFGWALAIGLVAPFIGRGISILAIAIRARVEPRMVLLMPVLGLLIGGLAIGFSEATDHPASDVLFSGQDQLPDVVSNAASWSVGALLLLMLCKALAYAISLSTFRGGPVFPAMFIGAAGGVAAAELPGMELVPAVGMGIGAMCAVMLTLPLTSVLLATLLMGTDGLAAMPVVIVATVVAYVLTAHLTPAPARLRLRPAPAEPPLHRQGERAARRDHHDVDAEDGERAGHLAHLADARRDAEVGRGGDRGHRDRDADAGARARLEGQHPGHPRGHGHADRRRVDRREAGERGLADLEVLRQPAGEVEHEAHGARGHRRHEQPERQGDQCARDEPGAARDDPDRGRGDRQRVGADRHRADDQDLVELDHPEARDDPGGDHEHEVAAHQPRVAAGLPEDVRPDQRGLRSGAAEADVVGARDRHVARRDPPFGEPPQDDVGGVRLDDAREHAAARVERRGERDVSHAAVTLQLATRVRERAGLAVHPQLEHGETVPMGADGPRLSGRGGRGR